MKKIAALFIALFSVLAHAAGDDIVFTKRKSDDSGQIVFTPAHNTSGLAAPIFDSSSPSTSPQWTVLGSSIFYNIPASGNAASSEIVIGSDSRLSDARTPLAHTQAASTISDSTSVGRAVLTAADATTARTAIGAGTSSFSGVFSALSGLPTSLSGYGITDAYPLSGNPSGFLTGITGSQVTSALGFTPYNGATNPNGYVPASALSTALAPYATTSSLSAYATTASLSSYATVASLSNYATTSSLTAGLSGKEPTIAAGTTSQYWRGDKTWQAFPTIPTVPSLVSAFTNDASYITQSGARSAITLTTTGSGAATYNSTTGALNIPLGGSGTVTSVAVSSSNLTVTGSPVSSSGTIAVSLPNVGTADTYNGSVTTDAQGRVVSATKRTVTSVTKALNTCFQVSATRDADVLYNVEVVSSGTLIGGQKGTAYLQTYTDSACTLNAVEIMRSTNGNTTGLAVALGNVSTTTLTVQGPIGAGLYAKVLTTNDTGTPTFTARPGWEKLN